MGLLKAQPQAPSIRTPSVVSTADMPAVNRAGNTIIVLNDAPLVACALEMPKSATSVAVSKPSPNRKPMSSKCQLWVTSPKKGRKTLLLVSLLPLIFSR